MAAYYRFNRAQAFKRPNQLTKAILGVTVGVTLLQFFQPDGFVETHFPLIPAELWSGSYWQLLTVTLVHGGPFHIFMNGYALWILGSILEPALGKRNFFILYVASALGGSIAIALLGDVFGGTVGASGAIFGLFGALIAYMYSKLGSFRAIWHSAMGRQLMILLVLNIFISFMPGISAQGHFGGLIVGCLMGYLFERHQSKRLAPGEKIGAWILGGAIVALSVYSTMPVHRGGYWFSKARQAANIDVAFDSEGNPIGLKKIYPERESNFTLARQYFERIGPDIDKSRSYIARKDLLKTVLYGNFDTSPTTETPQPASEIPTEADEPDSPSPAS